MIENEASTNFFFFFPNSWKVDVKQQDLTIHKGTADDTVFASGGSLGANFEISLFK